VSEREALSEAAVYVVTYFEVGPRSTSEAVALLGRYREATRKDGGLARIEVLQQNGRPDHFAIVETWRNQLAFDGHGTSSHTRALHEGLRPLLVSPCDERVHTALIPGFTSGARADGATYVLTHADAIPPAKDDAMVALNELAEASRHESGNVRYEVLQQRSRLNHFTIVEVWKDQHALEAHAVAAPTKRFRERFQPMSGSLYDERLYSALG
jgi:quinol monooxygenase YgiN